MYNILSLISINEDRKNIKLAENMVLEYMVLEMFYKFFKRITSCVLLGIYYTKPNIL